MIQYKTGDLFSERSEALVNPVNCVGIMGRGLARQFKIKHPGNFRAYAKKCQEGEMRPGAVFVYDRNGTALPRYIVNFPTKRHWRDNSCMEDIESGLASLVREVHTRGIRSISVPALGSGLGGLEWSGVRKRIEKALAPLVDVNIVVYEPGGYLVDRRSHAVYRRPPQTA